MATYINNIFNFGRSLPSPFDTIANKKIKVSSKYGDGTTSTLCGTVIKAVHAVCHCMDGSGEGAVGIIDHRTAAEYKSSAGADAYHLVVYDSNTGSLMASVYDSNMETFENYTLNSSGRDGAAVMMALFPMLMQDDEFKESFEAYQDELNAGYPHMDKATEYMALMCDNAYEYNKEEKRYGFYCNPNAMWDWYQIGGRWPVTFLVKADCTEYSFGERSWGNYSKKYPAPEGYMWVSAARKKDICWDVMRSWYIAQDTERYTKLKEAFQCGKLPDEFHGEFRENGFFCCGKCAYEQIEPHKKAQSNKWWKEKIRQTLQINPMHFTHDGRGLWSLNRNAA